MLKDSLNHQSFSLYKLPLIGAVVLSSIFFILQLVASSGIEEGFSDYLTLTNMPSLMVMILIFILVLLGIISIAGFIMSIFYHFRILCWTKKNIIFTIIFSVAFVVFYGLWLLLTLFLLSFFKNEVGIWLGFGLAILGPLVSPLLFFISVKYSQPWLDQYRGPFPVDQPLYYWRFANAMVIYAFYGLIILGISIILPSLGLLSGSFWLSSLSGVFNITMVPVGICLMINGLLPGANFTKLGLKQSWVIAIILVVIAAVMSGISFFLVLRVIFGGGSEGFMLILLLLLLIVFFMIVRVSMNRLYKTIGAKRSSNL